MPGVAPAREGLGAVGGRRWEPEDVALELGQSSGGEGHRDADGFGRGRPYALKAARCAVVVFFPLFHTHFVRRASGRTSSGRDVGRASSLKGRRRGLWQSRQSWLLRASPSPARATRACGRRPPSFRPGLRAVGVPILEARGVPTLRSRLHRPDATNAAATRRRTASHRGCSTGGKTSRGWPRRSAFSPWPTTGRRARAPRRRADQR